MINARRTSSVDDDRWVEALDWHTTLNESGESGLPHDKVHAWQEWVADTENRRVFDQLVHLLGDSALQRHSTHDRPSREAIEDDPYDASMPLAQWNSSFATSMPLCAPAIRLPRRMLVTMVGSVAAAVACFVILLMAVRWRTGDAPQTYQTRSGEVRRIRLEDGSSVVLGAQSSLSVKFTAQRRSMRLERGDALFQVIHDPLRPFAVTAGSRIITALGTAFVVRRESDRVMVTVTDGSVEVVAPPFLDQAAPPVSPGSRQPSDRPVAEITRGQQMSYADQGAAGPIQHADARAAIAWADGQLQFDDEPLRYVIETVNRYSHREIAVATASGDFHYTGLAFPDQIDDWVCGLESIYPVEVVAHQRRLEVRPLDTAPSAQRFCARTR